jgi:toxin ParE1/3/4
MQLKLSKAAQRDIDAMHAYGFKTFGKLTADEYVRQLLNLLDLLQENPQMGRERTDFNSEIRALRYKSHMIFYKLNQRGIRIHRILHGSQNWSEIL